MPNIYNFQLINVTMYFQVFEAIIRNILNKLEKPKNKKM